jgi:alcohol dehydrogenase, propanol-preferring
MYATQFAKERGANVLAVGRNEDRLRMAEKLGADSIIDASESEVVAQIRKETGGKGVDVMLDLVASEESFKNSSNALSNGGRLVLVGLATKPLSVDMSLGIRELSVAGTLMGTKRELAATVELARTHKIQSVATTKFTLDKINDAIHSLSRGEIVGRAYIGM